MGANQSSTTDGGSSTRPAGAAPDTKESYYELLGVDRHATDEELKKAYRRKALELHPDRNYGDTERTTALFATIQAAYEVLSDPQERAWYDSHEDAILRGADPTTSDDAAATTEHDIGLTSASDIAALLRRFHPGIPFTDAPDGFHGFLRTQFETLATEEAHASRRSGTPARDYPSFGHAADDTATARAFYSAWASFSTAKSFAWRDRYRASSSDDRRTRRAIERENARARREGAAEFSDAVRALVSFARRRDPRMAGADEERSEGALRGQAAAQGARMRAAHLAAAAAAAEDEGVVPAWARAREGEGGEFEGALGGESSSEEEHFECVACRKVFKSERQWEAHERSKKHAKAVGALRRQMEKEGRRFGVEDGDGVDEDGIEGGGDDDDVDIDDADARDEQPSFTAKSTPTDSDSESGADVEDLTAKTKATTLSTEASPPPGSSAPAASKHSPSSRPTSPSPSHPIPSTTGSSQNPSHPTSTSQVRTSPIPDPDQNQDQDSSPEPTPTPNQEKDQDTDQDSDKPTTTAPPKKQGKAAQKRAKRAAAQAASDAPGQRATCASCGAGFASRSQLFQHIRDHGHAAAASGTGSGGDKGRKKGKR